MHLLEHWYFESFPNKKDVQYSYSDLTRVWRNKIVVQYQTGKGLCKKAYVKAEQHIMLV